MRRVRSSVFLSLISLSLVSKNTETSIGTKAVSITPANLFARAPPGFVWIGSWEVVPFTERASADRSGWRYSTSFKSMLLVGGIWTTPTPFTVVRQRLWRRRVRRVSSDREDGNEEEEKTKLQVAAPATPSTRTTTTTSSPELLLLLNQNSDSQDTLQNNPLEKMTKDEDMKREKDTMDAKIKALKEQHDAQLQSTKDLFQKGYNKSRQNSRTHRKP